MSSLKLIKDNKGWAIRDFSYEYFRVYKNDLDFWIKSFIKKHGMVANCSAKNLAEAVAGNIVESVIIDFNDGYTVNCDEFDELIEALIEDVTPHLEKRVALLKNKIGDRHNKYITASVA